MKFHTLSWLKYLIKARHRGGHGIHSPFLYRLITEVIEDKRKYLEYDVYNILNAKSSTLLPDSSVTFTQETNLHLDYSSTEPGKLIKKTELPAKFGKMAFRLIREFHPSAVIHYGPSLGPILAAMALADNSVPVYQISDSPENDIFTAAFLKDSAFPNIHFLPCDSQFSVNKSFVLINYPDAPDRSRLLIQRLLALHGDDDVLIIRGIHQSKGMELIWQELIGSPLVHVSIDQFEIGIVLFRTGLQKENFIHRY